MVNRVTEKELKAMVARINNTLPGRNYNLSFQTGGGRLHSGEGRDISPRLPKGQLLAWLEAFWEGIMASQEKPEPPIAPMPRVYAEIMEGWPEKDAQETYIAWRQQGGTDDDYEGFERFVGKLDAPEE